jgi:hypothetical protein
MKFYNEKVQYARIPNRFWYRKGNVLDRLVGINTHQSEREFTLQPIYVPVIRFENLNGVLWIDFSWDAPKFSVVLSPRWPFVQLVRATKIQIEDV